jgi:hypothetical protein
MCDVAKSCSNIRKFENKTLSIHVFSENSFLFLTWLGVLRKYEIHRLVSHPFGGMAVGFII